MILASGLNFGIRASMAHLLGISFGFPLMIIIIGFGFGAVFEAYPLLHEIIKIIGITYLLYLAWRIATTRVQREADKPSKPFSFLQSALYQWVNPKGWIMGSSALATFTSLEGNFFLQVAMVALTFFVVSFPGAGSWLLFGAGLQKYLTQPKYLRVFNVSMAVLLVASITPAILEFLPD